MVGVSDPEFKEKRSAGWRFLAGLAVGYLIATLVVGVSLTGLALLLQETIGPDPLRTALLVLTVTFGLADLADRTPHPNRQVPQRFAREIPALPRGLLWGFDLGLLVTTQKTASLLWVALIGLLFSGPAWAILPTLLAAGGMYIGGVVVLTLKGASQMTDLYFGRVLIPALRRGSGVLIVGVALFGALA